MKLKILYRFYNQTRILSGFIFFVLFLFVSSLHAQDTKDWMSRLPDALRVKDILLPGTHDSATGNAKGVFSFVWKTQHETISEQLINGVRFLDLRCTESLRMAHGSAVFKQTLEEVLDTVFIFLKRNPSEYVIVSLRQEDRGHSGVFEDNVKRLLSENRMYKILSEEGISKRSLGDLRGKIVWLSRSDCGLGRRVVWSHEGRTEVFEWEVQDNFRVDVKTKKGLVRDFYLHRDTAKCALNFNTVTGRLGGFWFLKKIPYPYKGAKRLNKSLELTLSGDFLPLSGVIVLDFGESLYKSIISRNFKK